MPSSHREKTEYARALLSSSTLAQNTRANTFGHVLYFDVLRVLAAFAVVALHCIISIANLSTLSSSTQALMMVESGAAVILFRWAVPLFFMISGALMLHPQRYVTSKKVVHHIVRLVAILSTIGLCFSMIKVAATGFTSPVDLIMQAILKTLTGQSWDHLWFLYKLIGLYALVMPLRIVLQATSPKQHKWALMVMWITLMVLPNIASITQIDIISYMPLSYELLYFVAGYYLFFEENDNRVLYYVGALVSAVGMVVLFVYDYDMFFMPQSSLMFVYSAGICIAAKAFAQRVCQHINIQSLWCQRFTALIRFFASYSFGIYVLHVMWIQAIVRYVTLFQTSFFEQADTFQVLVFQLMLLLVSVVCSWVCTMLLRRLSFFAKYL